MVGKSIAQYKILKKLGEGGMGEVYLAEDTKLNRRVALKFLPRQYTGDDDIRTRFKREAQAAAALNHPNIVTIHEVSEYAGRPYISMEYVEGPSLKELIAENDMSLDKVLDLAVQMAAGLAAAHAAGVLHRDIKPQNVLVDSQGRVRILDFGLAKLKTDSMITETGYLLVWNSPVRDDHRAPAVQGRPSRRHNVLHRKRELRASGEVQGRRAGGPGENRRESAQKG
jgi:serine/threonine protein kinase